MREYLLRMIERDLSLPTMREWLGRVADLEPVEGLDVVSTVREGRVERDEQLSSRWMLYRCCETYPCLT